MVSWVGVVIIGMYLQNEEVLSFDPALLPVQPNVGVASISYAFRSKPDLDTLAGEVVTVIIDTPYNILPVSTMGEGLEGGCGGWVWYGDVNCVSGGWGDVKSKGC